MNRVPSVLVLQTQVDFRMIEQDFRALFVAVVHRQMQQRQAFAILLER